MQLLHQLINNIRLFLSFYRKATTIYDIHSPFVYGLVNHIFNNPIPKKIEENIRSLKKDYLANPSTLPNVDYGAGSRVTNRPQEISIRNIAKHAVSVHQKCQWLFNIAHYLQPNHFLELGTSLGISAAYIASNVNHLITLEGNPHIANIANETFRKLHLSPKVKLMVGEFDASIAQLNHDQYQPDIIYIDGNHTYEATMRYFHIFKKWYRGNELVLIFDDIYWSGEMHKAWIEIQSDTSIALTIDIYRLGIVFFNTKTIAPKHYTLCPKSWKPWKIGFSPVS